MFLHSRRYISFSSPPESPAADSFLPRSSDVVEERGLSANIRITFIHMSIPTNIHRRSRLTAWSSCLPTICGVSKQLRGENTRTMVKRATPQDLNSDGEEAKNEIVDAEMISETTDTVVVIHGTDNKMDSKGNGDGRGAVGSQAAKDELERGISLDYYSTQGTCEVVTPAIPLSRNVPVEITAVETSYRRSSSSNVVRRQVSASSTATEASKEIHVTPSDIKKKKVLAQGLVQKERLSEVRGGSIGTKKSTPKVNRAASTPGGGALRKQTSGVAATPMRTQSRLSASKSSVTPMRTQSRLSSNKAVASSSSTYMKSPPDRKLSLDRLPSEGRPSSISTTKAYKRQLSSSRITPAKPGSTYRAASKPPPERPPLKMGTPLDKSSERSKVLNRTTSTDSKGVSVLQERSHSSLKGNYPAKTGVGAKKNPLARSMSSDGAVSSITTMAAANTKKVKQQPPVETVHRPSAIPEEVLCSGANSPTGVEMSLLTPPLPLLPLQPHDSTKASENNMNTGEDKVDSPSQPPPPPPLSSSSLSAPIDRLSAETLNESTLSQPLPPPCDKEAAKRLPVVASEEPSDIRGGVSSAVKAPLENEAAPSTIKKKKKKKKKDSAKKRKKRRDDSQAPPMESPSRAQPESLMFVKLSTLDASLFKPPTSERVANYLRRLREVSPYDLELFPHPPSPPPKMPVEGDDVDTENGDSEGEVEDYWMDHDEPLDEITRGEESVEEVAGDGITALEIASINKEITTIE